MKRIVNGVTYNTATATKIARSEYDGHDGAGTETMYQTRGGAFFIHQQETRRVWNQREEQHQQRITNNFIPMSPDETHRWLMEGNVEVIANPFEDPPEATYESQPGATIYLRVPSSLKHKVEEAAREDGVSGNVWSMRCIERCLDGKIKKTLANAYDIALTGAADTKEDGALTREQIADLFSEIMEKIESAWVELDFFDNTGHPHIGTQITDQADELERQRICDEYPLYKE